MKHWLVHFGKTNRCEKDVYQFPLFKRVHPVPWWWVNLIFRLCFYFLRFAFILQYNTGDFCLRMREKRKRGEHVSVGLSRDWILKTNNKFAKPTHIMKSFSCFLLFVRSQVYEFQT
jgi:hypothetical protein